MCILVENCNMVLLINAEVSDHKAIFWENGN